MVDVAVYPEDELCHWLISGRDPPPVGCLLTAEDCAEEPAGSSVVQFRWAFEHQVSAVETEFDDLATHLK